MNAGNTIVPAKDSSHEMPCGDLSSLVSELDINKQPEPSTSTIPIKTPEQNLIKVPTERKSEKGVVDSMEFISKFIEPHICELSIKKSRLLDIKVACETLSQELNGRIISDKNVIDTLNSLIASNEQYSDKQKELAELLDLEESLYKLSSHVHGHYSGDKQVVDALEKLILSNAEFIIGKMDIESLCEEIKALLDAMLRPDTS